MEMVRVGITRLKPQRDSRCSSAVSCCGEELANGTAAPGFGRQHDRHSGRPAARPPVTMQRRLLIAVLFLLLAAASLAPIWSNDYFWHSAAGSWIVAHRALPVSDPLAVASSRQPWIDGEWLFQVVAALVENIGGVLAIGVLRAIGIAPFFTSVLVRLTTTLTPFTSPRLGFFLR